MDADWKMNLKNRTGKNPVAAGGHMWNLAPES
jgi:hypothetical protein